jgi:hypothetical protein
MNDGVKILLERMETHPEEFNGEINKWGNLLQYYKAYLDPEDANALNEGINKLLQQKFTEKVLEELVDPKKSSLEDIINRYRVKGMPSVGQTPMPSTITLEHTEHLRAHVDALQKEYADVFNKPKKEHKTIFGKLFNYT